MNKDKWGVNKDLLNAAYKYMQEKYAGYIPIEKEDSFSEKLPLVACSEGNVHCEHERLSDFELDNITGVRYLKNYRSGFMVTNGTFYIAIDMCSVSGKSLVVNLQVCVSHLDAILGLNEIISNTDSMQLILRHEEYLSERTFL
jgi:hypothetical protein